jgi:hypothetical protein
VSCKFCEGKEEVKAWGNSGSSMAIYEADLECMFELGFMHYEYLTFKINFCPMCGKKLGED